MGSEVGWLQRWEWLQSSPLFRRLKTALDIFVSGRALTFSAHALQ